MCITGTVREEITADADLILLCSLDRGHGLDPVAVLIDLCHGVSCEESDVLLGKDDIHLLVVLIVVGTTCVSDTVRTDLVQQVSESRIRIDVDLSAKTHAHLRRVVSTQDVAVLDKSHLAAKTCCSKSSTHS